MTYLHVQMTVILGMWASLSEVLHVPTHMKQSSVKPFQKVSECTENSLDIPLLVSQLHKEK